MILVWSFSKLPPSYEFPPERSHNKPYGQMIERDQEPDLEPGLWLGIAITKIYDDRPCRIVCQTAT